MATNENKNKGTSPDKRYYGNTEGEGTRNTEDRDLTNEASNQREEGQQRQDTTSGRQEQVRTSEQQSGNQANDEEDRFDLDSLKGKINRADSGK